MTQAKQAAMIVLDGVDGSGKGTQCERLREAFERAGQSVILTREPGGCAGAEEIRELVVKGEPGKWDAMTELLLIYAARRAHLVDTVWPALESGQWVICDRFADSSRAFQGVAGELGLETVEAVHRQVVGEFTPQLTLILDIDVDTALARAEARGDKEDRFERKGRAYHENVREAFRQLAGNNPDTHSLINADQSMDAVTADIIGRVNQRFGLGLQG